MGMAQPNEESKQLTDSSVNSFELHKRRQESMYKCVFCPVLQACNCDM